ncbi:heterokaryon incompatibility protein-domain-containing protein [Daldinia vernicosa]|uniref:heterokaryon incompatibility protein-domain-containing protein n=1 Tax=Daldinia vernicosa TaxID=114800 RepID=UPI002008B227|nr:heterokaryon incompatibility protein-domain-containing protein [Daldinia vernicosa]KAI0846301.1 heterokaryon incompatibility protein-domain-containing protein [Daldinia vernicosa]
MLCETCRRSYQTTYKVLSTIVDKPWPELNSNILHSTPQSLYTSILAGCLICRKLWTSILRYRIGVEFEGYFRSALAGDMPKTYEEFRVQSGVQKHGIESPWITFDISELRQYNRLFIELKEDMEYLLTVRFNEVISVKPPHKIGRRSTAEAVELWQHWYRTCLESHTKCRTRGEDDAAFTPDRLIEVRRDNDGSACKWRLVCYDHVGTVPYLTLSHCWGSSNHLCLTKRDYSGFLEFSVDSRLPKTYRDAFQITMSLGFQFIWIDSLCIIQDDEDDWKIQSSMMGLIYSKAHCNIAATWAADSTYGCFTNRDLSIMDYTSLKLTSDNGQTTEYAFACSYPQYRLMAQVPLTTRAWVIQERYLSKRQLSFLHQVCWRCPELIASEQYPAGVTDDFLEETQLSVPEWPIVKIRNPDEFRSAWEGLVLSYSGCNLTQQSDRLIAIAGLAGEMRNIVQDEYLAGMWKTDLISQLGWHSHVGLKGKPNRFRTTTYVAPTWSWANIYAQISTDPSYTSKSPLTQLAEIIGINVVSDDPMKLHSFTSSELILKGIAVLAYASALGSTNFTLGERYELRLTNQIITGRYIMPAHIEVEIIWDEDVSVMATDPDEWLRLHEERKQELLFMCITYDHYYLTSPSGLQGLVLRRFHCPKKQDLFIRIGKFTADERNSFKRYIAKRVIAPVTKDKVKNGIVDDPFRGETIDLENPELSDLVHTVTIV